MTAAAIGDVGMITHVPMSGLVDMPQSFEPFDYPHTTFPLPYPPQPGTNGIAPIDQTASPVAAPFQQFRLRPYTVLSATYSAPSTQEW